MQLYLIRHGQSYVNLKEWTNGFTDEGLTDLGQEQAQRLAAWIKEVLPSIDRLYASTMKRARETAQTVADAYGCDISFDDRLREIGNNRLDHAPYPIDEQPPQYPGYWASARPFAPTVLNLDNGETFMHFRTRIGIFVEEMVERHPGETVLVVAHGGVVESIFHHIFNIGPWPRCEIWDHNTAVTHFECVKHPDREVWRLHFHNRVEHLIGLEQS